jgi:hypothetical protein
MMGTLTPLLLALKAGNVVGNREGGGLTGWVNGQVGSIFVKVKN